MKFKEGDRIKAIKEVNPDYFEKGKIYTIVKISSGNWGYTISETKPNSGWNVLYIDTHFTKIYNFNNLEIL